MLLSSFVTIPRIKKIADFGAGSGIIGFLLAKKYLLAEVTLIELQEGLVKLAEKNAALNGLEKRVKIVQADIKGLFSNGEAPEDWKQSPPLIRPCGRKSSIQKDKDGSHQSFR